MAAIGYTSGDPQKLDLAGGTMTGPLILSGDPTVDRGAVTRQYVDALAGIGPGGFNRVIVIAADATEPPDGTPTGTVVVQLDVIPPTSMTGSALLELAASGQVIVA